MATVEKVSIALSSDMLSMVRDVVATGDYASTSEVIREALREWKARRATALAQGNSSAQSGQLKLPLSEANRREIAALCERYSVQYLSLFGSAAHGDFDPARSDVDVTVQFRHLPDSATAAHYFDLKQGLETVFGRPVDLVEISDMPDARLKREIERTQVLIYDESKAV
jgi:uncharacterized protein